VSLVCCANGNDLADKPHILKSLVELGGRSITGLVRSLLLVLLGVSFYVLFISFGKEKGEIYRTMNSTLK
jgi:hypothetical protein